MTKNVTIAAVLLWSTLGMTQYASGEGPPDESEETTEAPDENTDAEARALYEAGTSAFADGRFEDALARWREAHDLSDRPQLLYNIATALDRLGRPADAKEHYALYLEAIPDASNRNYVMRRISVLTAQIERETRPDEEPEITPEPEPEPPSRVGPIVVFSVAGAALVTGIVTGIVANDRYSSIDDRCTDGECPPEVASDRDNLRSLTRTTDALIGGAVLAAIGGVVWWFATGDSEESTEVACGLGTCRVRGRF